MGLFNKNDSYSDNEGVRNTAKSLRYKTDNFALYIFTTWYYHQNYRKLDPEFSTKHIVKTCGQLKV